MSERFPTPRAIVAQAMVAFFVLASAPHVNPDSTTEYLAMSVGVQVVAADRALTSDAIAAWAEETDGYFVFRSLERVVIRVPNRLLGDLRSIIEAAGAEVVAYNPATVDLRAELRNLDAAIASRSEALEQILDFVDEADIRATLAFERELRSLNAEIEAYTGRRRELLNDVAYARVEVLLSMRERTIPGRLPSSFAWINTLDLYRFIDEMRAGDYR